MALVRFSPRRVEKYELATVSINKKKDRFNFNTLTYDLFYALAGEEVTHVQIYLDDEDPDIFYLAPAQAGDIDSRKLMRTSKMGKGRGLEGKALLNKLGWEIEKTTAFRVIPNEDKTMLMIDRKEEI